MFEPGTYDIVYAILAGTPRHDRQGRRVSTAGWNRAVAAEIAAAVTGLPPSRARRDGPPVDPRMTAAARCIEQCADVLQVDLSDLLSTSTDRPVVEARQITGYVLRRALGMTWTAIGALLGRDHTTILYGERRVVREMVSDEWWRDRVRACVARVGDGLQAVQ